MSAEPVAALASSSRRLPRRRALWIGGVSLVLVAGIVLGPAGGWRRWEQRRAARLVQQARAAFDAGDFRNGQLATARALQLDPTSADACGLMADAAARAGRADEALSWARQGMVARPDIPAGRLHVARLALRFDRPEIAVAALDGVTGWARGLPGYHSLRGALALRQGRPEEAATEFAAARRGDPDNENYLFDETKLRLATRSGDPDARAALSRLAAEAREPALRTSARQVLIADDVLTGNTADLRERGRALEADPNAGPEEWLPYLDFLFRERDPRADPALERLLGNVAAGRDPAAAAHVLGWMVDHGLAPVAARWGRTLPGPLRSDVRQVRPAVAAALAAARDWNGLREFCGAPGENWNARESLRYGYLAFAASNLGDAREVENNWNAALTLAAQTPGAARILAEAAAGRGATWNPRLDALLWSIADNADPAGADPAWALDTLRRRGLAAGDTRALLRVTERALVLNPRDPAARRDHATFRLLRGENLEEATEEARVLFEEDRSDPAAASTYALALLRRSRATEAVALLRGLPPERLREPSTALVYGLALQAAGDRATAPSYLEIARTAAIGLLPEERALLGTPAVPAPANP